MLTGARRFTAELAPLLDPRDRRNALWIGALMLLGGAAEAVGIGLVFPFISLLAAPERFLAQPGMRGLALWAGGVGAERLALYGALALIGIYLAKNLFLAFLFAAQARFISGLEAKLGSALLGAYLRAPYLARLERSTADQLRIIVSEVNRATAGYLMSLLNLLTETLVTLSVVLLLLAVEPAMTLAVLLVVGATAFLFQALSRRRLNTLSAQRVSTNALMHRWASQGLGAFKEIKALGREGYFVERFAASSLGYARANSEFTTLNLLPRLVVESVAVIALLSAVALTIGAGTPMNDIVPVLTLFGLAAVRLMPSATRIVGAANGVRFFAPALRAVAADLRAAAPAPPQAPPAPFGAPRAPLRTLEFRKLSFRYPGSAQATLEDIDLTVRQGELIGIVGRSGSGKTTLADLLLGLLEPDTGEIRVNGVVCASLMREWRGVAGFVPQSAFLLDDSVRRNVAFGKEDGDIDDGRVWSALELARLASRVRALPGGLDSQVGEHGALLSGGERQRLCIARALYDDPDILILDEATSSLDPATEAEFIATLQSLKGRKTIMVVTHRIGSTEWCDRVVVMQNGRIAADGAYADLARRAGEFRELLLEPATPGAP